jgi:hypothetical protein
MERHYWVFHPQNAPFFSGCIVTKPPKRPRDFSQAAKFVIEVATGEREDRVPTPEEQGKDPAAAAMGRRGGAARARNLTEGRRSEIAKQAAAKRWKKD